MITTRVKTIVVLLQVAFLQFFFQGCSSNKPIAINIRPVSLSKSEEKINLNIAFAHADDLENFSFKYKTWGPDADSERVYVDKLLYDADIHQERTYRYLCRTVLRNASVGNILKRNAETVLKNVFNEANTLQVPDNDHLTGTIDDHQRYKEFVPPGTNGIIKLRSAEVRYFVEFKKPPGPFDKPDSIAELVAEWVLEDLQGNEIWSGVVVGSGLYDYGVFDSFKTLIQKPFQPAVDDHFVNLAHAIQESPEVRLFEACLQINCDRLLASPSLAHETLNAIQNNLERRQIANKLVYLALEKSNVALLNELLSTDSTDVDLADKYYQRLPIHLAVQKNNFEGTKLLIASRSAVDAADSHGFTPLHYAVSNGHTKITELLIKNGADVNTRNAEGQTPFILAVENGHQNDWQLLLDNGANPHAINEEDPLWTAVLYKRIGLHLGEKGDKARSTEALTIASDYFEKASAVYNRVSKRAATKAFMKDIFEITLLTIHESAHPGGSQWVVQERAKRYAEIKAMNDARVKRLSEIETRDLIEKYKSDAHLIDYSDVAAADGNRGLETNRYRKASSRSIADYYSKLSEICHNSSLEVNGILECFEEQGARFKECLSDEISQ